MPLEPKFCSQCGHELETRYIDDRIRQICDKCSTIHYKNPLPVAAVVLMNQERKVLLVKRKKNPRKGLWCLPMGFAELNETIAEAALRELEEETGVKGRVKRLIAAISAVIEVYGDTLIVTFEVEKSGGEERAGCDADELAYFDPVNLPDMAFESNVSAIKQCIGEYQDEWAIQDSYKTFEQEAGRGMLSDSLVAFIRDNAKEVSERWLKEVISNQSTVSYKKGDYAEFMERIMSALLQFTRWLSGTEADAEVRAFYRKLGADRRKQSFELHEIISSLTLFRKQVLTYARDKKVWRRSIDFYTLAELDRRFYIFFDKAIYHVARGFLED